MKTSRLLLIGMAVLSLALMLAACNGGGSSGSNGGGSVAALTVAEKVSVVDAQESGGGLGAALMRSITLSGLPASSDYRTDKTSVYVNERSVQAFSTVNEILCMVAQTRYDAMVNAGPYKAQIDTNLCSSSRDDASAAGQQSTNQSSGSTMPNYESWTVISSRESDTAPHIVTVWVHEEGNEHNDAKTIEAKLVITESSGASNPYGLFSINFKGVDPQDTSSVYFKGFLKTEVVGGQVQLRFANEETNNSYSQSATLVKNGSAGTGTVYEYSDWDGNASESQFNIAFNAANFLRSDGETSVCLDRTQFEESAWRYGLYNSTTGARVTRNSGFPIKTVDDKYGWVGYWGLWLPNGVTVANGDTVYKHDYQTNTDTPYTVVRSNGKLKKHTRKSMVLSEIKNVPLSWGDCSGGPCVNYQVIWTGTEFDKVAVQDQQNYTWTNLESPVALDTNALQWGELNFWSQSLGGQVRVKLSNCLYNMGTVSCGAPTNATPVIFYAEDIVYPDDAIPATLACFDNCPKAIADGAGGKVDPNTPMLPWSQSTYNNYAFDTASMLLTYGGNAAVQKEAIMGNDWGIMSGPMFEPTAENIALLACDWEDTPGHHPTCGWKAWSELTVFYTWETGLNDWNKFTALTSGSTIARFDPPLQVEYVHHQTGDKYDGVKFYLDYSGFGELQGIPGKCVNMDTGETVSCGPNTRWVPEITIPDTQEDGSLTEMTVGGATYVAKALEKEQRMRGVDVSICSGAGLDAGSPLDLPVIDDWTDPALGTEPAVGAPAIIGGVVQ